MPRNITFAVPPTKSSLSTQYSMKTARTKTKEEEMGIKKNERSVLVCVCVFVYAYVFVDFKPIGKSMSCE